jgi:hypothetical protein
VKALTKKKKENENVLIDLEFINSKNVLCCNFEELRKKEVNGGQEKISENFIAPTSIIGDGTITKEESGSSWCQEKTKGL